MKKTFLDSMGIDFGGTSKEHKLHLVWCMKHGYLRTWPKWFKKFIVKTWNPIICFFYGHDRILEGIMEIYDKNGTFACTACSKRLKPKK